MKLALISLSDKEFLENAGDRYPLGLLYIAGTVERAGHEVEVIDLNYDFWIEKLLKFRPNFVGISFTSSQYNEAISKLKTLRAIFGRQIKFIAGGVHPSIDPISCKLFDYVISGEGEFEILKILENKTSKKYLNALPIEDLDIIPYPAWHKVDMDRYNMLIEGQRTATLITSRGCPGSCIYCSRTTGRQVRFHSAEYVVSMIEQLYKMYNYKSFYFLDDTFTYDKKRINEIVKLIKKKNLSITLRITTRADYVTENTIKQLKSIGLQVISLGIEHIDNNVLKKNGKGMTIESNLKAIQIVKKYNIKVKGFFILNLPGATKESIIRTIIWAKYNCDYQDFYRLVAFPGTPIWNYAEKLGMTITDKSYGYWEAGKKKDHNIENNTISNKEIDEICKIYNA